MRKIPTPYCLFLGDAGAEYGAKTAEGVLYWRPEACLSQFRLPGCEIDLGLPDMGLNDAKAAGAKTVLIGVTNRGGFLPEHWLESLIQATDAGLDIAAGLHQRLNDIPALKASADANGCTLHDVRHWPGGPMPLATGEKRTGRRALMIGTDCAVGKKFTALAIHREMTRRAVNCTFRPTGQTGALIAGYGSAIDAIPGDFISGVAEALSPDADPEHWDIIEGQASVLHPTFASVTLGLVHGSQPDALILCHAAGRAEVRGLPGRPLPSLKDSIDAHLAAARLTNPSVKCVAVSVNTAGQTNTEAAVTIKSISSEVGLPTTDPIRFGAGAIVDAILKARSD